MKAVEVSRSTKPLISRNIAVSFRRMGQSPNAILPARSRDDLCRPKQLGAEGQPRSLGRLEVDAQADFALVEDEADDAAGPLEVIAVADGENGPAFERGKNARPAAWPRIG